MKKEPETIKKTRDYKKTLRLPKNPEGPEVGPEEALIDSEVCTDGTNKPLRDPGVGIEGTEEALRDPEVGI